MNISTCRKMAKIDLYRDFKCASKWINGLCKKACLRKEQCYRLFYSEDRSISNGIILQTSDCFCLSFT